MSPQQMDLLSSCGPLPEMKVPAQKAATQAERLYQLLQDRRAVRSDVIVDIVYGRGLSLARVAARIYDIKRKYGVEIDGHKDAENPKLYWYSLKSGAEAKRG